LLLTFFFLDLLHGRTAVEALSVWKDSTVQVIQAYLFSEILRISSILQFQLGFGYLTANN